MAKVPFRVSARAARLIGRENVATSQGAVTELVKNAYDADADVCAVLFVPRWSVPPERFTCQEVGALRRLFAGIDDVVEEIDSCWQVKVDADPSARDKLAETLDQILDLWIIDNGHGMSADIINERWMVIGTNAKELNALSDGGRVVTGAKGIGRFALDRLGGESDLYSGQYGADSIIHWFVDWTDFEGAGKVVSDVEALLETEKQPLAEIYTTEGLAHLLPKERPAGARTETGESADSEAQPGAPIAWDTGTAIRIGLLDIVLASTRAQTFSPPVFTDLGIDLSTKTLVVVKSSNHFHAAFAPIAASVLYLDSGGPYPPDASKIAYTKVRRPFSPLDPNPWL